MTQASNGDVTVKDLIVSVSSAVQIAQTKRADFGSIPDLILGLILKGEGASAQVRTQATGLISQDDLADMSAKIHGRVVDGITQYLKASPDVQTAQRADSIAKLLSYSLISEGEAKEIGRLTDVLNTKDLPAAEMREKTLAIDSGLRIHSALSPTAKTILGVAVDSVTHGAVAHADVDGALVGAILGTEVGGPGVGTLVGGLCGAGAASVAAAM